MYAIFSAIMLPRPPIDVCSSIVIIFLNLRSLFIIVLSNGFIETTLTNSALMPYFLRILSDNLISPRTDPCDKIKISLPLEIFIFFPNLYL